MIHLIGKNGQLGWELQQIAQDKQLALTAVDIPEFDIGDRRCIERAFSSESPNLVINASAYTAVDKAETEKKLAYKINCDGVRDLAEICATKQIPLIHVSTDYVFDGNQKEPYKEHDPVNPINVYGDSKNEGEIAIREAWDQHVILRTAWLYGNHGNNFVKTMLRLGEEREEISVVNDQFGNPTFALDLARAIMGISEKILNRDYANWGTYHYSGDGATSWYHFAQEIFREASQYQDLKLKKVHSVSTDQYPTAAKRPINTSLDCSKIKTDLNIPCPPWKESLALMLKRHYSSLKAY